MIAVDTSITIPAFSSWHERHESALAVVQRGPRLPAHVAAETSSVLTRLPDPHRVALPPVMEFLESWFPDPWLPVSAAQMRKLLHRLAEAGVSGGGVYDGIVAASARQARATLCTADARAARVYDVVGVDVELI